MEGRGREGQDASTNERTKRKEEKKKDLTSEILHRRIESWSTRFRSDEVLEDCCSRSLAKRNERKSQLDSNNTSERAKEVDGKQSKRGLTIS